MNTLEITRRRHVRALRARTTPLTRLGVRLANVLGTRSTPLLKLYVFSRLQGFLRHIVLTIIDTSFPGGDLDIGAGMRAETHADFLRLAADLGVAVPVSGGYVLDPAYAPTVATSRDHGPTPRDAARSDYDDVRRLIDAADAAAPDAGPLARPDVRYLVVLATYVLELEAMQFERQTSPSFSEAFYSDLGELAYELYTKRSFDQLCRRLAPSSALDVGCGEGRHVEAILRAVPDARVTGLERQPDVARSTRRRLAELADVTITTVPFLDHETDDRFDMVLSSFMLFYMPEEERVPFFERVRELLAPGGTYVIGQYFPDVEDLQEVLVRASSRMPGAQLYLCSVGNSLARAEALLNRTLSDFRSVAYWHTVVEQLAAAGLAVDEVVPADDMYYSYYLLVRRAGDDPVPAERAPTRAEVAS